MASEILVYKLKNFIRKNESGELSKNRIREIIDEIGALATFHPDHNILIDSRETSLSYQVNMADILETAIKLSVFKNVLTNKIANIIPEDENRVAIATKAQAAIQIKGIEYKFFTEFEEAIEWLSEKNN